MRFLNLNMQDVIKLVKVSTGIDFKKTTFLEKSNPSHKLCEACIIKKQCCTLSYIINKIDFFKCASRKVSCLTVT